jgi:hypothetical protein
MWWAVAAAATLCVIVDKGKERSCFLSFSCFHGIKYP